MFGWDIQSLGREFKVPIVRIEGELDLNTPTALARRGWTSSPRPERFEVIEGAGPRSPRLTSGCCRCRSGTSCPPLEPLLQSFADLYTFPLLAR